MVISNLSKTTGSNKVICTILAKNYLAFARVMVNSFLRYYPNGKCYALVIDDYEGYIDPRNENFDIIPLSALNIPNLKSFCFKYDILELSCAVRPFFWEYLFNAKSINEIIYFDPDILILNPLDNLFSLFDSHDILLTPHITKDYPNDGLHPTDHINLVFGAFNLGFIGLKQSRETQTFLDWLKGKTYDRCLVDLQEGVFCDQKFYDFAHVLFDNIFIVKDHGYNVAWWNLHYRKVTKNKDKWYCNDGPLYFYHFSNFQPEHADIISPYQTRYKLSEIPGLLDLFHEYRDFLLENGYEISKNWPYSYGFFKNGVKITPSIRNFYRNKQDGGRCHCDPFKSKYLIFRQLFIEMEKSIRETYVR